jgi:multidrug resistance efflux pump
MANPQGWPVIFATTVIHVSSDSFPWWEAALVGAGAIMLAAWMTFMATWTYRMVKQSELTAQSLAGQEATKYTPRVPGLVERMGNVEDATVKVGKQLETIVPIVENLDRAAIREDGELVTQARRRIGLVEERVGTLERVTGVNQTALTP